MRLTLPLGLFVLAFGTVAGADAQGRRRNPEVRQTTVVVEARPTRHYDGHRARHERARNAAHVNLQRQRRGHEEIVRISRKWRQATYRRDPYAKRNLTFRANAWIDREIALASARPNGGRYAVRLDALQRELNTRHRRYGHRHGTERRARVFDELVALSAAELRRAEIRSRRYTRVAFSVR